MNARDIETTLRARASFEASVKHLDRDTGRRLRALRLETLEARLDRPQGRWAWAGGLAAAGVLALLVFVPQLPRAPLGAPAPHAATTTAPVAVARVSLPPTPAPAPVTAVAIAPTATVVAAHAGEAGTLETADPEMLSDLDFYHWLATQPGGQEPAGG
ncbi:MAG: hypothetical protein JSS44_11745 [Proteobacteria bacterium]|nr:hypothetical protein [Pseudomonadota bacterium]MBS0461134.1 hypothetical protein [Pseudomonadota bacterium]MBS0464211.1 hypothetical protein [Pseudomonadota bacterium]